MAEREKKTLLERRVLRSTLNSLQITIQRLTWTGHLIRLNDNGVTKKIFVVHKKEEDQDSGGSIAEKDLKTINVRSWKSQAKNWTS
ncbi:hypothetical protein TNCT_667241 [Trichonephila clavata]|uniref:Uncharacterized protein n=1 Tax=Trichonephila clavata TaxID=2740835 RepID=A0A8X6LWF8_TRICU|nr:hypothetical protein TNCT_667241 [Trichonephila clavata]